MREIASVWSSKAYLLSTTSHAALSWSRCWHEEPAFRAAVVETCGALAREQHRLLGWAQKVKADWDSMTTKALLGR